MLVTFAMFCRVRSTTSSAWRCMSFSSGVLLSDLGGMAVPSPASGQPHRQRSFLGSCLGRQPSKKKRAGALPDILDSSFCYSVQVQKAHKKAQRLHVAVANWWQTSARCLLARALRRSATPRCWVGITAAEGQTAVHH